MQKRPTLNSGISLIALAGLLSACGGGGGDGAPVSQTAGTLRVSMTDAPACGYDAVNVTVSKVRIHQSSNAAENDSGWTDITLSPARKINLLNLTNGVLEELGQAALPAGRYTQLRLVLDTNAGAAGARPANSVVPSTTGTEVALETPSAAQSGIKLTGNFDVASGQLADVVLDFDACKSVVRKGNGAYALKPVVSVIPAVLNGIRGVIDPATLGSGTMVTAQQNGVIIRSTVPNASTGEFYLARMEPGSYDVVLTSDARAAAVIAAVPVASATSTVAVSTSTAPIKLVTAATPPGSISGTVTLTPASATENAYVAARQSFANGPTVTIKYQGAEVATGVYSLANLPTVPPLLGRYDATQPVTLTAQTNTVPGTGRYAVEAGANGYAPQTSASVDISTASRTGVDFSLK
ncbi:DUF4382 domain-containing protein [Noviherbaspirillum aerium]|uniref:DUF4382 domain-containing protein n=1 Tax=Noviherbaspirillum aerium TaxID=2588497 RepID=UPI00124E999B|nr:DUF4382 domain-containing protein [Noviherbaspirillum aerium]